MSDVMTAEVDVLDYHDARLAIRNLTRRQREVLGTVCVPVPRPPTGDSKALRALEATGLIVCIERSIPFIGGLRMTYLEWDIASQVVHLAWCDHCCRKPLGTPTPRRTKPKPTGAMEAMMDADAATPAPVAETQP